MNVWAWADTDPQNFPKDEADLNRRLAVVARGVPNQDDNINPFAVPAFELFKDCGLIEQSNIKFLSDQWQCNNFFNYKLNPLGGVLRHQDLSMWDDTNQRYYSAGRNLLYVSLAGVKYYISNHWLEKCKRLFFNWLAAKARQACQKRWAPQPTPTTDPLELILGKIAELEKVNLGLCSLIAKQDAKIDRLTTQVNELLREWKGN